MQLMCTTSPRRLRTKCGSVSSLWQTLHFCSLSTLNFVFETCICRRESKSATGLIKEKEKFSVHCSKNVNCIIKLTQVTLCLRSSAWAKACCNLTICLWWKVSLRDTTKNWETSWTDQDSGRSWSTFSSAKTWGWLLRRSTAAPVRSLELR